MIEPSIRLRRAITFNNPLLVTRILNSHPHLLHNPDVSPHGQANSSLHLAASLGLTEVCRRLLDLGHESPTPALNEVHQTALMLAAANGHTDVVHLLSQSDPTCILRRDARGRDAIMEACRGGHDTCLLILLTMAPGGALAAVQRADVDGNTAMHFASGFGHQHVLRTLIAAGADPDVENIWSWTPITYSATVQIEVFLKSALLERAKHVGNTNNDTTTTINNNNNNNNNTNSNSTARLVAGWQPISKAGLSPGIAGAGSSLRAVEEDPQLESGW